MHLDTGIPMNMEFLKQIQDEFTTRCGRCVIAGGSVRDVLMGRVPKDYDVFCFNEGQALAMGCFDGLQVVDSPEWHKSEPHLQATVMYAGFVVQIMASECKSLKELVGTFDWNVSCFGFDQKATPTVYEGAKLSEIGEGKELKINRITYPVSSLRRGFRFSERFGMKFDAGQLGDLCAMASGRLAESRYRK